jgi:hypothetical protein
MSADISPQTPSSGERDWPAGAADKIVEVVGQIKGQTIRPVKSASRTVVYGLVIAIVAIAIVVLVFIALFRVTDTLLGEMYLAYLVWGLLCTIVGLVLWSKRTA